jgi:hypothetical protein
MNSLSIRHRLHEQIDRLPDELVQQVADFALFLNAKQQIMPRYENWSEEMWQEFSLQQFFRTDDEPADDVVYSLNDAREVYHP